MHIQFNDVIPLPLADTEFDSNSVWNNEIYFNSKEKIVLNAVSGKGKSTFIGFLSGLRTDFTGEIFFDNKSIKQFNQTEWITFRQNKIATVYQDLKLFDNLSVIENINIKNNLTHHFSDEKIKDYIYKAGLTPIQNKLTKQLSYGQKQRVAIIRALAQPFELLLLDEPFSHLDIDNQKIMIDIIEDEVKKNNAGFVLTSLNNTHPVNYDKELIL